MIYKVFFGILAAFLSLELYVFFNTRTTWSIYASWAMATSIVAILFYWLDKRLSKIERFVIRVPELILNALAAVGGFPGAWIGRTLCQHKTNIKEHGNMFLVLVASTLIHLAVLYWTSR